MTVDELEPIAREATRHALEKHVAQFDTYRRSPNLTLGTLIDDDVLTFQLYVAGEKPIDAIVLTSTRVSRMTGEVLSLEVHLPPEAPSGE